MKSWKQQILNAYVDGWEKFEEARILLLTNSHIYDGHKDISGMESEEGLLRQLEKGLRNTDKTTKIFVVYEINYFDSETGFAGRETEVASKVFTKK